MGCGASVQQGGGASVKKEKPITPSYITIAHLQPGDLVKFKQGGGFHWAVYLGEMRVIHVEKDIEDGDVATGDTPSAAPAAATRAIPAWAEAWAEKRGIPAAAWAATNRNETPSAAPAATPGANPAATPGANPAAASGANLAVATPEIPPAAPEWSNPAAATPGTASTTTVKICEELYWTLAKEGIAIKANTKDGEWEPLQPDEVIKRAKGCLGESKCEEKNKNSQHFAKWCRYDKFDFVQEKTVQGGGMDKKKALKTGLKVFCAAALCAKKLLVG